MRTVSFREGGKTIQNHPSIKWLLPNYKFHTQFDFFKAKVIVERLAEVAQVQHVWSWEMEIARPNFEPDCRIFPSFLLKVRWNFEALSQKHNYTPRSNKQLAPLNFQGVKGLPFPLPKTHRWKKSSSPTFDVLRRAPTVGTTPARAILPFASRTTRPRPRPDGDRSTVNPQRLTGATTHRDP